MPEPPPDQTTTLKTLFASAEQARLALDKSHDPTTSPAHLAAVEAALTRYATCQQAIARLALFSPNESLEDLPTAHLPYLLVGHHVGNLTQRLPSDSPQSRSRLLQRARAAYEAFLSLADSYSLLPPAYAALHSRYAQAPRQFSSLGGRGGDPAAMRNAKMANYRAEKLLRSRVAALSSDPRYLDEDGGGGGGGGVDEDLARELHLAHVAFCVHVTFQQLEGLNREEDVLAQAVRPLMPETTTVLDDERRRRREGETRQDGDGGPGPDGYSDRLDRPAELRRLRSLLGGAGSGPVLSRDGKPLQPFTLVSNRREVQKGVFRPGHNLPTMTIDEYLAEERRRGNVLEGGGEASLRTEEPDEDDLVRADAETMKAREWDEFKEANPRGWGNTLNRG